MIDTKEPKNLIRPAEEILPLVLKERELIFADLESTGFGAYDDITEIGAVRVDVETGKILDRFSTFAHLKDRKTVPAKITELTKITTEMLEDAPSIESVLTSFCRYISGSVMVFHNAAFDWRMLQQRAAYLGKTLPNEVICTMKLFKYLHPGLPANLDAVCEFYGKPIESHHRAVVDCAWTAACYRKMRAEVIESWERGQISIIEGSIEKKTTRTVSADELRASCAIYRICGWKKARQRRIYVSTSYGDIYYDLVRKVWNVARRKTQDDLDLAAFEEFLLESLGSSLSDFITRYQPAA